jgi:phosphatidylserine decarboxylase
MGHFKLGSTVILLFPEDTIDFAEELTAGTVTRMGDVLGKRDD